MGGNFNVSAGLDNMRIIYKLQGVINVFICIRTIGVFRALVMYLWSSESSCRMRAHWVWSCVCVAACRFCQDSDEQDHEERLDVDIGEGRDTRRGSRLIA